MYSLQVLVNTSDVSAVQEFIECTRDPGRSLHAMWLTNLSVPYREIEVCF